MKKEAVSSFLPTIPSWVLFAAAIGILSAACFWPVLSPAEGEGIGGDGRWARDAAGAETVAKLVLPDVNETGAPAGISAAGTVTISILPSVDVVGVNQVLSFTLWMDAANLEIAALDAGIDFDPVYLQVVDVNGAPITTSVLIPGNAMPVVLGGRNTANNTLGTIDFSFGAPLGGPYPMGTFLLATGYLRATVETSGASISIHSGGPTDHRNAVIGDRYGNAMAGVFVSSTIAIKSSTATATATGTSTPTSSASATATASATPSATATSTSSATPTAASATPTFSNKSFVPLALRSYIASW